MFVTQHKLLRNIHTYKHTQSEREIHVYFYIAALGPPDPKLGMLKTYDIYLHIHTHTGTIRTKKQAYTLTHTHTHKHTQMHTFHGGKGDTHTHIHTYKE